MCKDGNKEKVHVYIDYNFENYLSLPWTKSCNVVDE
jgi:hypothetical protein